MARSDKYTLELKKIEMYSDFLNSFDVNPITGYLGRVTNENSVKQSMKNILFTMTGERFYSSDKGSRIVQSLFEPVSLITIEMIELQVKECLERYEPRAIIHEVKAIESIDSNGYDIGILFSIINIPDQNFTLELTVTRAR